jgi:hypothetical protein
VITVHHVSALDRLLDRSRLFVLITALETDLRAILQQWVLPYKEEEAVFGGRYGLLRQRVDEDGADPSASVLHYADFADSFEIVNRHATMVPAEVARAVKGVHAAPGGIRWAAESGHAFQIA